MTNDTIDLNADQSIAAAQIRLFLKNPRNNGEVFTLTGSPGTGKTFMLKQILEGYKGVVQGATVSHSAKNVLQKSLGSKIECVTLAKLLGLNQVITDEGEVKFIRPKDKSPLSLIQDKSEVLIIDEVSQIPDTIYDIIMHEIKVYNVKVIAVGDPYQLPPVEQETDSKFFKKLDATLRIPMRFQGPIADLAAIYRTQIDNINTEASFDRWALNSNTHRHNNVENDTGYLFTKHLDEVIERAADDIKSHPDDLSYARVLAFKNESVAEINQRIRTAIYGNHLAQFEKSELVICDGGYTVSGGPYNKRVPVLHNGQILRVSSFIPVIGPHEIPCLAVKFENFPNFSDYPVYVVEDSFVGKAKYNKILGELLKEAKKKQSVTATKEAWKRYYHFMDLFAYLNYGASLTLYRAQGQTLTNVYVCEGEVMNVKPLSWKQKFQALYVAMTRAKEKLFIYNKEF